MDFVKDFKKFSKKVLTNDFLCGRMVRISELWGRVGNI
jgi:hypothetical protein